MRHFNIPAIPTSSQKNLRKKQLALAITQTLWLGVTTAHAATITVDSNQDPGGAVTSSSICTLRDAIQAANTNAAVDKCSAGSSTASDNIVFASGLTTSATTITLGGSALSVSSDMSIDGADNITINAAGASQVMDVSGGKLALSGLTLTGGYTSAIGGGLFAHQGASVSLSNSTISGNTALQGAGGLVAYRGGTTVSLSASTVSGNVAGAAGGVAVLGGVLNLTNSKVSGNTSTSNSTPGGGGVLAYYGATVNLTNSTVSGNSTGGNGGGFVVSDQDPNNSSTLASSTVSLVNSTVSGNSAAYLGGGILTVDSNVSLTNSTVSGNSAGTGGGVVDYGMVDGGSASLVNSTVSGNSGGTAGGVGALGPVAVLSLTNSIVANSTGGKDCYVGTGGNGTVTADAFNIIADGGCSTSAQAVNPMLGALADNGGPTLTHLPQTGSPAINGGDQAACTSNQITTDQRGYSRSDGQCDIGSVEVGAKPPPNSGGGGGGGATGPLMLLFTGMLWPLRRRRRRG
ncbi:MAG: choice-of-anchor Q domain-containing protein [Gammaproteobacteria bacterium]